MYGKIQLEDFAGLSQMPQKYISAWQAATADLVGVKYKPLLFCGTQIVKGVNFWFIAEQSFAVAGNDERRIVKFAINEFDGNYEIVKDSIEIVIG